MGERLMQWKGGRARQLPMSRWDLNDPGGVKG
jgi:hypothetical protein